MRMGIWFLAGVLLLLAFEMHAAPDQELEFAEALISMGFPDYAEKVLKRRLEENPALRDQSTLIQLKILIGFRKFAAAESLLQTLPPTDPLWPSCWLALGDGYMLANNQAAADKTYNTFLQRSTAAGFKATDATREVMLDVAYRLVQLREKSDDFAGALQAYERLTKMLPTADAALLSKVQCAQAELYLKYADTQTDPKQKESSLSQAAKVCGEVLWRGVDVYFGRALLLMARIDLARGQPVAARKRISDNRAVFLQIEDVLRKQTQPVAVPLALSPMAEGLFLLGKIDQESGESLAEQKSAKAYDYFGLALKEFNALVSGYPESAWAAEAAQRAAKVREKLLAAGKKAEPLATLPVSAKPEVAPARKGTIPAQTRVKVADEWFFRETNYARAQVEYQSILRDGPDTTNTPRVLVNFALCHLYQQDLPSVKAIAGYLGERFAAQNQAGIGVLQIARAAAEQQNLDLMTAMYELFLENFPKHDNAPAVLYSLALIQRKKGDDTAASATLLRLIRDFPNDPHFLKALEQLAWWSYKQRDYEQAADLFKKFLKENRDPQLTASARFGLGNCLLSQEKFSEALEEFRAAKSGLESNLAIRDAARLAERDKKDRETLEQIFYLMAFCLTRMEGQPQAVKTARDEALQLTEQFLRAYTNSVWAPKMMSLAGTVHIERGAVDAAAEIFNRLANEYPESAEGKNAFVSLVQSALSIGKYDIARDAFQKMMADKNYFQQEGRLATLAYLGRALLDAGLKTEAIAAYQAVISTPEAGKALLENACFNLGRACLENGDFNGAVKALNRLLEQFPQSGHYFEARFLLVSAQRELGNYQAAYEALSEIASQATDVVVLNRANLELSKTQVKEGLKQEALASLLRITLLADAAKPELRPLLEEAFLGSIKLQQELKLQSDLADTCRQYLAKFPKGSAAEEVTRILRAAESSGTSMLDAR